MTDEQLKKIKGECDAVANTTVSRINSWSPGNLNDIDRDWAISKISQALQKYAIDLFDKENQLSEAVEKGSIEFSKWLHGNNWRVNELGGYTRTFWYYIPNKGGLRIENKSDEKIYQEFLKSQNK